MARTPLHSTANVLDIDGEAALAQAPREFAIL